jgi:anti-sigma factor RsiW
MTCDKIQERFADYLTGDLDEAGQAEIQAHIAACPACREDLENLTLAWAKLGVLPEEQPTNAVRGRFYAMLEDYKTARTAAPAKVRVRDWFTFRRPAFAASFSALLLLAGLGAGWLLSRGGIGGPRLSSEVQDMRQQVAISLLNQSSAADRLQGVSYSSEVKDPKPTTLEALFKAVDTDPNPNVRLAAVDALYLFRGRPGVRERLVQSLSTQSYPLVQVALIDFLVEVREAKAVEALKKLIDSGDLTPDVKQRAEQGLKQITI